MQLPSYDEFSASRKQCLATLAELPIFHFSNTNSFAAFMLTESSWPGSRYLIASTMWHYGNIKLSLQNKKCNFNFIAFANMNGTTLIILDPFSR